MQCTNSDTLLDDKVTALNSKGLRHDYFVMLRSDGDKVTAVNSKGLRLGLGDWGVLLGLK